MKPNSSLTALVLSVVVLALGGGSFKEEQGSVGIATYSGILPASGRWIIQETSGLTFPNKFTLDCWLSHDGELWIKAGEVYESIRHVCSVFATDEGFNVLLVSGAGWRYHVVITFDRSAIPTGE